MRFPLFLLASVLSSATLVRAVDSPVIDGLHQDLDRRFIVRPQGLVLDYVNTDGSIELPKGDEPTLGKPNSLSWWTPLENGPFLSGLYLDGVLLRWQVTKSPEDARVARELVQGLLKCASLNDQPAFIARGFYPPENTYYPIGSDDQTAPWFYGLWKYLQTDLPTVGERKEIEAKILSVADALAQDGWKMPCAAIGDMQAGETRGEWAGGGYRAVSRRLFASRIAYEISRDDRWRQDYESALTEAVEGSRSRIDIIEAGIDLEWRALPQLAVNHLWIYVVSQAMVAELARLESDAAVRARYETSLQRTAERCAGFVRDSMQGNLADAKFLTDWRVMNASWRPQTTPKEAVDLAMEQLKAWGNRGRDLEVINVREPACAAWIAFYAPKSSDTIAAAASKFGRFVQAVPWTRLHSSAGIFAESAWYLLNAHAGLGAGLPKAVAEPAAPSNVTVSRIGQKNQRATGQFDFAEIPTAFSGYSLYTVPRGASDQPGSGFELQASHDGRAWLLVMPKGNVEIPEGWEPAGVTIRWKAGDNVFADRVYQRAVKAGETIVVPPSEGIDNSGTYAIPHALILEGK